MKKNKFDLSKYILVLLLIGLLAIAFFSVFTSQSGHSAPLLIGGNCSVDPVFLPLINSNYLGSVTEIEPNNTSIQGTGPLTSGRIYSGTLDIDEKDYFYFYVVKPGNIDVHLIDPDDPTGIDFYKEGVQLQLFYTNGDFRTVTATDVVAHRPGPTYSVVSNTTALGTSYGWYYVYIYGPRHLSSQSLYHLQVIFPNQIVGTPSTPLPLCTPTATPTSTPTFSPTPPDSLPFQCKEFVDYPPPNIADGSYVLPFDGTKIVAGTETDLTSKTIPPGNYHVTLFSFDDEHGPGAESQDHEIWRLVLYDANNAIVVTSNVTTDLDDELKCDRQMFTEILSVSTPVASYNGKHGIEIATPGEPNSVFPWYAVLEPAGFQGNKAITSPTPTLEN